MKADLIPLATKAAIATASSLGLPTEHVEMLQDSNRLVARLLPCDTVVRVGQSDASEAAGLELDVARQLSNAGAPIATVDQRVDPVVHSADGFAITFWKFYRPVEPRDVDPEAYASSLGGLHEAMRKIDIGVPHYSERILKAEGIAGDPGKLPAMPDADRVFLLETLGDLKRSVNLKVKREQIIHGEPHSDNLLRTKEGLLFADFEACCRGPIEFDVADIPEEVADHYPNLDPDLLSDCRVLVLAMVATWCWAGYEEHENLRRWAPQLLDEVRTARRASLHR